MAAPKDIIIDSRPIRLVLDRSFFHDAFRTDYPKTGHAKWILSYLIYRQAITRQKICITSSLIIDRLAKELKAYPDVKPQTILALQAITDMYNFPYENMKFDHSTLYVAKMLFDTQFVPIILSSVKAEKWKERAVDAGIDMGLEEFSEGMSVKRVTESIWFAPSSSVECCKIFKELDRNYPEVVAAIGRPPKD